MCSLVLINSILSRANSIFLQGASSDWNRGCPFLRYLSSPLHLQQHVRGVKVNHQTVLCPAQLPGRELHFHIHWGLHVQVWSLTQFYSVDFSNSRISVKIYVFNKRTMFASVVVGGVLGPPRLARHTWRCPCISVVPEATFEASRGPRRPPTVCFLEK